MNTARPRPTLDDWRDHVARMLAKARTHGDVKMDNHSNPLPTERQKARMFIEDFLNWIGNEHYVTFTDDRFTVEHSIECRLSGEMPLCRYHEAVDGVAHRGFDPELVGRWRIDSLQEDGTPNLSPAAGTDEQDETP